MFSRNLYKKGIVTGAIPLKCNPLPKLVHEYPNGSTGFAGLTTGSIPSGNLPEGSGVALTWNWVDLSQNPNMTWEFIENNPNFAWNWASVCLNPCITPDIIRNNPGYAWHFSLLSRNPSMTREFVEEMKDRADPWGNWDSHGLLMNPSVSSSVEIENNPNSHCVIYNPNVTWASVKNNKYITDNISCYILSTNPGMKLDNILYNPGPFFLWDWDGLSTNPNITWEFVKQTTHRPWNYNKLSANPAITWENVCETPEREWSFSMLSTNPNIPCDMLQTDPRFSKHGMRYANPNITLKLIRAWVKKYEIDWVWLSYNKFLRDPVAMGNLLRDKRKLREVISDYV